jgi:predicted GH43/DUF377 family glycosyl hydrolase
MKFERHPAAPVLKPQPGTFYGRAVYNPAVLYEGDGVQLLFRAEAESDPVSGRVGLAHSLDGMHFTVHSAPVLIPEHDYEIGGCEDPRLVCLDGRYVMTYVGRGRVRHHLCLATADELTHWQKHGEVLQPRRGDWDSRQVKAGAIVPMPIRGRYAMFYLGESHPWETAIGLAWSDDLMHWDAAGTEPVLAARPGHFDSMGVEPGPPPIPLDEEWLLLYNGWNDEKVHCIGAALLDRNDPGRVLARAKNPLLRPERHWECKGPVPNVVFGEGAVCQGETLYLYYGAADQVIGRATLALPELYDALQLEKV